jgi:hypothetical protein
VSILAGLVALFLSAAVLIERRGGGAAAAVGGKESAADGGDARLGVRVVRRFVRLRGPVIFFVALSLLMDSVMEAGVSLVAVRWTHPLDVVLGMIGAGAMGALFCGLCVSLMWVLRRRTRVVTVARPATASRLWDRMTDLLIAPMGRLELVEAADPAVAKDAVDVMESPDEPDARAVGQTAGVPLHAVFLFSALEPVFGEYTVIWFGCAEYALTLTVSGLVGSPRMSASRCESLAIGMLALYLAFLLLLVVMRPHTTRLGMFISIASETLCFGNCVMLYLSISRGEQGYANAMRYLTMSSYVVMWMQLLPAVIVMTRLFAAHVVPVLRAALLRLRRLLCSGRGSPYLVAHGSGVLNADEEAAVNDLFNINGSFGSDILGRTPLRTTAAVGDDLFDDSDDFSDGAGGEAVFTEVVDDRGVSDVLDALGEAEEHEAAPSHRAFDIGSILHDHIRRDLLPDREPQRARRQSLARRPATAAQSREWAVDSDDDYIPPPPALRDDSSSDGHDFYSMEGRGRRKDGRGSYILDFELPQQAAL